MKIDKQQVKKYATKILKWYLVGLIIIPLIATLTSITVHQFREAEIDGKGGYERSLSHPFICLSGPAPDTPSEGYCGYFEFFNNIFTFWGHWFAFLGLIGNYLKFSWIILPAISILIYFRDMKLTI